MRCHAQVNPGYEWCPHCGSSLHTTRCAYCGRTIKVGLDDCPSCGAPVMGRATV
ncbi:MAG: zinc ribbon domain-containing protein [Chloroflexi bacterium]|nr:zinc ribbon domain-containing protein [Chloroflexota bacterium]